MSISTRSPIVTTRPARTLRVGRGTVMASDYAESAKSAPGTKHPKWTDPGRQHQHGGGYRDRSSLPIRIGRLRPHGSAGDDEAGSDRSEAPAAYHGLPRCVTEAMPEPIGTKIDQARWPAGGTGAREGAR